MAYVEFYRNGRCIAAGASYKVGNAEQAVKEVYSQITKNAPMFEFEYVRVRFADCIMH